MNLQSLGETSLYFFRVLHNTLYIYEVFHLPDCKKKGDSVIKMITCWNSSKSMQFWKQKHHSGSVHYTFSTAAFDIFRKILTIPYKILCDTVLEQAQSFFPPFNFYNAVEKSSCSSHRGNKIEYF